MATVLKSQDRGKLNLQKSVQALTDASFVLENGQSITYEQLLEILSAALTVSASWGSITGTLSDQTDLQAALDGLQTNLDSLLTAGYLTSDAAADTYVPYSGATTDINLGTSITTLLKNLKGVDASGLVFKNSDNDTTMTTGVSGRVTVLYGHLTPDTNASRDLGNIITALKCFQNIYATNSLIINPSVDVSAVAMLDVISNDITKIGQIIKARSGQTADLSQWRDSAGQVMSKVSNKGFYISPGDKVTTSRFDKTSNTTYSDITGLSVELEAGKTYTFSALLYIDAPSAGGFKTQLSGTCTSTYLTVTGFIPNSSYGVGTSLNTTIISTTAALSTYCRIEGTIVVNAAGTFKIQFAQSTSNATMSSVRRGSYFTVKLIS